MNSANSSKSYFHTSFELHELDNEEISAIICTADKRGKLFKDAVSIRNERNQNVNR